jgi:hypothetical protein
MMKRRKLNDNDDDLPGCSIKVQKYLLQLDNSYLHVPTLHVGTTAAASDRVDSTQVRRSYHRYHNWCVRLFASSSPSILYLTLETLIQNESTQAGYRSFSCSIFLATSNKYEQQATSDEPSYIIHHIICYILHTHTYYI